MVPVVLFLLVTLVAGKSTHKQTSSCLAVDGKFYNLLSTMTPYHDVRGDIGKFKDCEAEGIWAFVRHATRFPHDKEIAKFSIMTGLRDEIIKNHQEGRGALCPNDVELFKLWHLVSDKNQNMLLTISGVEELRKFGVRMGKTFPDLLEKYDPSQIHIRVTSKERTRQSAEAFVTGLYKTHMKIDNHMLNDTFIKNEGKCPAWKKSLKSDKLKEEEEKFKNSSEMKEVFDRVRKRLGFRRQLTFEEVKDMYDICGFEYSWYHSGKFAPWCTAFTERDLQIMEFYEDVRYYYKSAFGNPLTPKIGCAHVSDIIQRLSSGIPKASFFFGHSMGNRKLLTTFGIGQVRQPLTGDSFSTSADRAWRTSNLTPFAANFMAVRYKCKKGSYGVKDKTRIAIFVNENLTPIPACGGHQMCSLEDFTRVFAPVIHPSFCNRDFCGKESASPARSGQFIDDSESDAFDDDY